MHTALYCWFGKNETRDVTNMRARATSARARAPRAPKNIHQPSNDITAAAVWTTTVPVMGSAKGKFIWIYIIARRIDPLRAKYHTWLKTGLKIPWNIKKVLSFGISISGKWSYKFLNLYRKRRCKFYQISKTVPTPRTLELVGFGERSTFNSSSLFGHIKLGPI